MRRARALPVLLALVTAACAVGPDYKRPSAPVPAAFKEQALPGNTAAAESNWKPAEPRDDTHRGKWWEVSRTHS